MRIPAALLAPLALALACGPAAGGGAVPAWPDTLPEAAAFGARRGLTPVRAILHVHGVHSHDACDEEPIDPGTGLPDEACLRRLKVALCLANVGAAFVTDHERNLYRVDSLADALYLRAGEERVTRAGRLAASRVPCADPAGVLLFAGSESELMTIGLDSLPRGAPDERLAWYARSGPGAADAFRRHGAVVLFPHPEDAPLSRIAALDPDLLEIVNPHALFAPNHRESLGLSRLGGILGIAPWVLRVTRAHPDLAYYAIFRPARKTIDAWDALLGERAVYGYGASDAHENALPVTLADGLRGDAYERMIPWVTNVLLVDAAEPVARGDVAAIEDAVRSGRFFVAIEAWGTPAGFDMRIEGPDGTATEMGETVVLEPGQRIVVEPPRAVLAGRVAGIDGGLPAPRVRARLLRIVPGRRTVVAESEGAIDVPVPGPGAYRVEVGIVPRHLAPYLATDPDDVREVAWVYGNPIRVVEGGAPGAGPVERPAAAAAR